MKPSYQASPRLPNRLMLATAGFGPPEVRDAEQRRLRRRQRRHVHVARHDEAARAQVLVAGRQHQAGDDLAIDLELRLDAGAALDVGIDRRHARQHAGRVGRSAPSGKRGAPAWPNDSTAVRYFEPSRCSAFESARSGMRSR